MNEIIVRLGDDLQDLLVLELQPQGKPYKEFNFGDFDYLCANDDVHNWMIENNVNYQVSFEIVGLFFSWNIIFENKDDAMLFKLTWGGK